MKGGERKVLVDGGSDARYVPTDHLIHALSGTHLTATGSKFLITKDGGNHPVWSPTLKQRASQH